MLATACAVRSLVAAAGLSLVLASCDGRAGTHSPTRAATPSGSARLGAWFADRVAVQGVLDAARREIAATSSYDYRHLDSFRSAIRASTTGPLTHTLLQTVDSRIAHTGTTMRVIQTAAVSEIGVGTLPSTSTATVLAVGQVTVHSTKYSNGLVEPFDIVATLRKGGGRWLLTALNSDGRIDGEPPGSAALGAASAAARSGLQALLTFHRASFARDFAQALAATTGDMRRQVAAQRSTTLTAIRKGGFDISAQVRALAIEAASGDTVTVLAQLDGFRIVGGRSTPASGRSLRATLVQRDGRWLLSAVRSAHPSG